MKIPRNQIRLCGLLLAGLVLSANPAGAAIQAHLESPAANFPASGVGNVAGWVYTTTPGATIDKLIEVQVDSEAPYRVPCCASRGDVKAAHPAAPLNTGFSGAYNFQRLSSGSHTIQVTFTSSAAEEITVSSTFEVVKVSPYKFLKSFRWKPAMDCESLNGLDPANGSAGAACVATRAVSKSSGNPAFDCDGTIQFAFNRASQTFQPVAGCDPQGTLGGGGSPGGGIDIGTIDPGIFDPGNDNGIKLGPIPPGGFTCLAGGVMNASVAVQGLVPTFTFTTTVASAVVVEVWEQGKVGQELAAIGNGTKETFHQIKPFPLLSTMKPNRQYEYQIRVKSNCGKPDLIVDGPGSFSTLKRVTRAYIDKAYIQDDGDDWPKGAGEISFGLDLTGSEKWTGEYSLDSGDTVHPSFSVSWNATTDHFELGVLAAENDYPAFTGRAKETISFGPSLTYSGGTAEFSRWLQYDNLDVKVWGRVVVTYE